MKWKLWCGVGGPKLRVHPPPRRRMLPPGSIWFTGQLLGLGYCKTLREAVCPPIESLPGTRFASAKPWHQAQSRHQHSCYILLPPPPPFCVCVQSGNWGFQWQTWKYTGGTQWGSSSQAHLPLIPSLLSFIAVLGTTSYSDRRTPSTCPHRLKLVECRDSDSSILFLSKSMLCSQWVDSIRAEWVVRSTSAHSLWHKAMDTPRRVATWKNLFRWGAFTLPPKPLVPYKDEPFATWHAIS